MAYKEMPIRPRFESKFTVTPGCWLWNAGVVEFGYGVFVLRRKNWPAHRFSYHLYVGEIPDGMFVCHRCDNPRCVNPDHLFLGSPLDNMLDKIAKGRDRSPKGVRHRSNKLSEAQVLSIRADTRGDKILAAEYGISAPNIWYIRNRKTWRHI